MNIKVFTQFRAPVASHPLGIQDVGLLMPGRYSGYDVITGTSLSILLKHTGRVKKSSPSIGGVITENIIGNILMPNGCRVQAEQLSDIDGIALNVDSNATNSNQRFDLVVCEHEYVQVQDGIPPLFFIQKGNNLGDIPTLAFPKKQIVIGIIRIAPDGNTFASLTFTKTAVPFLGDNVSAEILEQLGIIGLLAGKTDNATTSALDARVTTLENDTTVANLAQDVFFLEGTVIPAIDVRVTNLENAGGVVLKVEQVDLNIWLKDRKYTIPHNIPAGYNGILTCNAHLVCISPEAGYGIGDITPIQSSGTDQDGGSDYDYGISVQFNTTGSTTISVLTGDRVYVRNGKYDVNVQSNCTNITPSKWGIRLVIFYY